MRLWRKAEMPDRQEHPGTYDGDRKDAAVLLGYTHLSKIIAMPAVGQVGRRLDDMARRHISPPPSVRDDLSSLSCCFERLFISADGDCACCSLCKNTFVAVPTK